MTLLPSSAGRLTIGSGVEPLPPLLFGSLASIQTLEAEAEHFVALALTMMIRARHLVEANRVGAIALLNARRKRLGEHFRRYQIFKHGQIFDPVIAFGPASSKIVAQGMKIDCLQLGETFSAYNDRWRKLSLRDWPSYRRDMIAHVEMITVNLQAELRAMRQLLMIAKFRAS